MKLLGDEATELLIGPQHHNNEYGYHCDNDIEDDKTYLKKENYLSEFRTEYDKARARKNLGIIDSEGFTWENIKGDLSDNAILKEYLDKLVTNFLETVEESQEEFFEKYQNGFYSVATIEERDALEGVLLGAFCYVENLDSEKNEIYHYYLYKPDGWQPFHASDIAYSNLDRPEILNVKDALDAMLYHSAKVEFTYPESYYADEGTTNFTLSWNSDKVLHNIKIYKNTLQLPVTDDKTEIYLTDISDSDVISFYAEDLYYGIVEDSKPVEKTIQIKKKYRWAQMTESYDRGPELSEVAFPLNNYFEDFSIPEFKVDTTLAFDNFNYYFLPKSTYTGLVEVSGEKGIIPNTVNKLGNALVYAIYRDERSYVPLSKVLNPIGHLSYQFSVKPRTVTFGYTATDGRAITVAKNENINISNITLAIDNADYGTQKYPKVLVGTKEEVLELCVKDKLCGTTINGVTVSSIDITNQATPVGYGTIKCYHSKETEFNPEWESTDSNKVSNLNGNVNLATWLNTNIKPVAGEYLYYAFPKGLIQDKTLAIKVTQGTQSYEYAKGVTIDNIPYIVYREAELGAKPEFQNFLLN